MARGTISQQRKKQPSRDDHSSTWYLAKGAHIALFHARYIGSHHLTGDRNAEFAMYIVFTE